MFCKNCGTELRPGAKFCQNCGAAAPIEESAVTPQEPVWTEPEVAEVPQEPVWTEPEVAEVPEEPAWTEPETPEVPEEPAWTEPEAPEVPEEPAWTEPETPEAPEEPAWTEPETPEVPEEPAWTEPEAPEVSEAAAEPEPTQTPAFSPIPEDRPKKADKEKGKKKGISPILIGIAAAVVLVVVLAVIFIPKLLSGTGGSSKSSNGRTIVMVTEKGGIYLGENATEIISKSDNVQIIKVTGKDSAKLFYARGSRIYFADGKNEDIEISKDVDYFYDITFPDNGVAQILYQESGDEQIYYWQEGMTEPAEVTDDYENLYSVVYSADGSQIAFFAGDYYDEVSLFLLSAKTPDKPVELVEEEELDYLLSVSNDGVIYYSSDEEEALLQINAKGETVEIADTDELGRGAYFAAQKKLYYIDDDKLYVMADSAKEPTQIEKNISYIAPVVNGSMYSVDYSGVVFAEGVSYAVVMDEDMEKWSLLNLENDTLVSFYKNKNYYFNHSVYFADANTAYVRNGEDLVKLTSGKDGWTEEKITKKDVSEFKVTNSGIFYRDGEKLYFNDGKEEITVTKLEGGSYYSVDYEAKKSGVAVLNGDKILYTSDPAVKPERIVKNAAGYRTVLSGNYIYYVNEKGKMVRIKTDGTDETELVNKISYFYEIQLQ